jgi:hypothetical protein
MLFSKKSIILQTSVNVLFITKNEEKNIRRCLESIKWVDEIVIVDDYLYMSYN